MFKQTLMRASRVLRAVAAIALAVVPSTLRAQDETDRAGDRAAIAAARIAPARYAPTGVPDRIVLTWTGDPTTSQAVSWRTDSSVTAAIAEIGLAPVGPIASGQGRAVRGKSISLISENGPANHHSVVFTELQPDTRYVYRVHGAGTQSEWFPFRTAARDAAPFTLLYFGDAQNDIASQWSRLVRTAFMAAPDARFMIHAGDLVSLGNGVHDDEWGGWFEAASWIASTVPSIPATGNHEHLPRVQGERRRDLSPHWGGHFTLPENGPAGLDESVYHIDFQGVRTIVLNSFRADLVDEQARWLEGLLAENPNRWTIVTFHHPLYAARLGRDNSVQRERWQPLFERYGVDLVLQGHDHAYARGQVHSSGSQPDGWGGPVYVISVAGPKQALIAEPGEWIDRLGENLQLFQTIRVDGDTLRYESRTATTELYDRFDIVKPAGPSRGRMVDRVPDSAAYRCDRLVSGPEHRCAPREP